jgi:hypothetical protein
MVHACVSVLVLAHADARSLYWYLRKRHTTLCHLCHVSYLYKTYIVSTTQEGQRSTVNVDCEQHGN